VRFQSVVLDVDSTISSIEGIDWLAALRDTDTAQRVQQLTTRAMAGELTLDEVYAERLRLIRPTRAEISALSEAYIRAAVPHVASTVIPWLTAGLRVVLVSGGLREAISNLAALLGVPRADVHAVDVVWNEAGVADGIRAPSLLAQSGGKPRLVESLQLPRPILAVGDGMTDAELAPVVDCFIAFTGVVRREAVVARAAQSVDSFLQLDAIVRDQA
jgi:phosphoserine phosphatase